MTGQLLGYILGSSTVLQKAAGQLGQLPDDFPLHRRRLKKFCHHVSLQTSRCVLRGHVGQAKSWNLAALQKHQQSRFALSYALKAESKLRFEAKALFPVWEIHRTFAPELSKMLSGVATQFERCR
jgi:hypothetical protein